MLSKRLLFLTNFGPDSTELDNAKNGCTFTFYCSDVNECSLEDSTPCDSETEVCHNLMGSYVCKCREGLVKSTDGRCIPEEELPPEVKPKKPKKKKKSKKGKVEPKDERPHYPWYYTIGPVTLLFLVKKFCQPNIVTSAGLILFVVISATLSPQA